MNKCFLVGNLTRDPELRYTQSGTAVVNFGVAIKGRTKEDVIFVDCEAWATGAEFINKWFKKGNGIVVDGSLRQDSWQDKDGKKRNKLVVRCDHCSFPPSGGKRDDSEQHEPVETGSDNGEKSQSSEDVPF